MQYVPLRTWTEIKIPNTNTIILSTILDRRDLIIENETQIFMPWAHFNYIFNLVANVDNFQFEWENGWMWRIDFRFGRPSHQFEMFWNVFVLIERDIGTSHFMVLKSPIKMTEKKKNNSIQFQRFTEKNRSTVKIKFSSTNWQQSAFHVCINWNVLENGYTRYPCFTCSQHHSIGARQCDESPKRMHRYLFRVKLGVLLSFFPTTNWTTVYFAVAFSTLIPERRKRIYL